MRKIDSLPNSLYDWTLGDLKELCKMMGIKKKATDIEGIAREIYNKLYINHHISFEDLKKAISTGLGFSLDSLGRKRGYAVNMDDDGDAKSSGFY